MSADRSARLEAARLLAGVDVHPTSLPPSAVLLVRRLADPAPGSLNADGASIQPSRSWARALQRAVDRAAREAVRPVAGPVPPSATAVLFLDPAELLACLARDFLSGDVTQNWWWQAWLRAAGRSPRDLVLDAWSREARAIPAAIAALQRQDLATPFVRALSSTQVLTLVVSVAEAYECPSLAAAARPDAGGPAAPMAPTLVVSEDQRRDDQERAGERTRDSRVPVAPWDRVIPSVVIPASLPVEQRLLLGVTLALWHAPLVVRTREFQRALQNWRRHIETQQSPVPDHRVPAAIPARADAPETMRSAIPIGDQSENAPPPALVRPVEDPVASDVATARGHLADSVDLDHPDRSPDDASAPSQGSAARAPLDSETVDSIGPAAEISTPRPCFVETPARHREQQSPAFRTPISQTSEAISLTPGASSPASAAPAWPRVVQIDSVVTELGGVLFLVNVLENLRFFDRLDDHFRVASSIGAWGWLEIVARCLLGRGHVDAATDPIWGALGELDRRAPGVPIAQQVRIARDADLPVDWPRPARVAGMRVRPLAFDPAPDLRRFLDRVVPYVRWRLLHALDLPSRRDAPLASRLCYRRGRLEWTATHVDLHMDMSAIDIAVRLAGLDANPGWVPALGRVVTFHFD